MKRKYQYFNHTPIPLFEFIGLLIAGSLSITILYQIFVTSNWNYHTQPGSTLSWTSLIR